MSTGIGIIGGLALLIGAIAMGGGPEQSTQPAHLDVGAPQGLRSGR